MRQLLILGLALSTIFAFVSVHSVAALGLKVAPLEYRTTLKEAEVKKGFIDISNPSSDPVTVSVKAQAFRQIDNNGGLQFYDDKQVGAGIKPELTSFDLGGREAIRLYFMIDGRVLPEGDIYAALFFTTAPKSASGGVGQLVRVGTIFSIVNKTSGPRQAEIVDVDLTPLQVDSAVQGSYRIKNTSPGVSGFYPTVTISSWPNGEKQKTVGSLLFAGRTRQNDFSYRPGLGIHRIDIGYGNSIKSRWIVVVSPWMLVVLLLLMLVVALEVVLLHRRRKNRSKKAAS
jgi:hypothetical protein